MVEALVWGVCIFGLGAILTLERRCLGQMAVVQPLIICSVAGWLAGIPDLGIWLGTSLQLFSVTLFRKIDWALCGVVSAAVVLGATRLGLPIAIGSPEVCTIAIIAVLSGMGSRELDSRYARLDSEKLRNSSPFNAAEPAQAVCSVVHRAIGRWLIVGGIQVTLSTFLAMAALKGIHRVAPPPEFCRSLIAAIIPAVGAATALSSLAAYRYLIVTGSLAALSWVALR